MHNTGDGRARATGDGGHRRTRTAQFWGAAAVALGLTVGGLSVPAASTAATTPAATTPAAAPETVSADGLPTVQIDGVVYAQEVVGNTVYVGGSFSSARPAGAAPGTSETPRANLLAYDLTTGELISSWNPGANNTVLDIKKSADGSRIYVAGMFSQAAGAWRYRVAAFDTATGALITDWAPEANGRIDGLAITDTTVYLAGEFTTINGTQRTKVAAVSTTTGAVTPFTATVQGGYGAKAVVVSPDRTKVVISGSFTSVNGSTNPGRGITALNATTGTIMPWAMNSTVHNSGTGATVYSLASDGDSVYGTGQGSASTFEGAFRARWSDGSLVWLEDCHGDSYDVAPVGDTIYVVSHAHHCGNIGGFPEQTPRIHKNSLAFSKAPTGQLITADKLGYRSFTGLQAPTPLHWYPDYVPGTYTKTNQGPWQVTASGDYLLIGGEFLKVNGVAQQGIVRYATKTAKPSTQGPQVQGAAWTLGAVSSKEGNRVTWTANYDRDDTTLRYQLFRRDVGMTNPIGEGVKVSSFWNRPAMYWIDNTAVPKTTYEYRIRAYDPNGNSTQSDWFSVTTAADAVANKVPVAAFTSTVTELSVAFDGSGSTDAGGSLKSYAWAFGDGTTATGAKASHTYTAPGTYSVSLTVTDNGNARNTVTKQVTIDPPAPVGPPPATATTLAKDAFTRTVPAGGWGSADTGGAWTLSGGATSYSTTGTGGVVSMAPSQTRSARLLDTTATDALLRVSVTADQVSTGGAATATVIGRQVGSSNYSARVRFEVGGGVRLYLLRDETALGSYLMPGVTYTPGTVLNVALSVTGTNPTTLSAKVWKATDTEPATWQVTATDTTAAMQAAGTVGLMNTVSGASTLPSTVFTWDDLTITTP